MEIFLSSQKQQISTTWKSVLEKREQTNLCWKHSLSSVIFLDLPQLHTNFPTLIISSLLPLRIPGLVRVLPGTSELLQQTVLVSDVCLLMQLRCTEVVYCPAGCGRRRLAAWREWIDHLPRLCFCFSRGSKWRNSCHARIICSVFIYSPLTFSCCLTSTVGQR